MQEKAKPIRPLTTYQVFVKDYLTRNKGSGCNHKNLFSQAAKEWKGLSEYEKIRWTNFANEMNKKRCQGGTGSNLRKKMATAKRRKSSSTGGATKTGSGSGSTTATKRCRKASLSSAACCKKAKKILRKAKSCAKSKKSRKRSQRKCR